MTDETEKQTPQPGSKDGQGAGDNDVPYTPGHADQRTDGTGPFTQRELARLRIVRGSDEATERRIAEKRASVER